MNTHIDITQLAQLANLKLNPKVKAKLSQDLATTVDYVSRINDLKLNNLSTTQAVTETHNITRKDVVDWSRVLTQEKALNNAVKKYKGYFVIPAIHHK